MKRIYKGCLNIYIRNAVIVVKDFFPQPPVAAIKHLNVCTQMLINYMFLQTCYLLDGLWKRERHLKMCCCAVICINIKELNI